MELTARQYLSDPCGASSLPYWNQVSPAYRGRGLGAYVVTAMLNRMAGKARFATVSGQVNHPSRPEKLYRRCGFQGNDRWHVLRRKGL